MICHACGRPSAYLEPASWVACLELDRGTFRHETFRFGHGSPWDDDHAEVQARAWLATERKRMYPAAGVRLYRIAPAGEPTAPYRLLRAAYGENRLEVCRDGRGWSARVNGRPFCQADSAPQAAVEVLTGFARMPRAMAEARPWEHVR